MIARLAQWNGKEWVVMGNVTMATTSIDPIVGEAERGDTLADIDRALGPALDPFLKRMLPGRTPREREAIRKEIVSYVGDVIGAEQAAPVGR